MPSSISHIDLSSSDNSAARNERLARVAVFASGFAEARYRSAEPLKHLVELNDHKGDLTAKWKSNHAAQLMAGCLEAAWVAVGRELKENVKHVIVEEDRRQIGRPEHRTRIRK